MEMKTRTEELLGRLSTAAVPCEDADRAEERRAKVVARLAELTSRLPDERRKIRRLRTVLGLASAAALVLVAGYSLTRRAPSAARTSNPPASIVALDGSVQIVHQASEVLAPPNERVTVTSADEVVTGVGAHARASLESGTEIDIEPDSRVRLPKGEAMTTGAAPSVRNEAVALASGRVEVRVPKLGTSRTFSIETPEATVVVHGTKFSVERHVAVPGVVAETRVAVTEGSVSVRRDGVEVLLHAGDRWSSSQSTTSMPEIAASSRVSGAPEAGSVKPRPAPPASSRSGVSSAGRDSADESAGSRSGGSSLAAENRLLQTAMVARQEGNPRRAAALAAELVARYPLSPLLEEARVERMRALFALGGASAAASEARAYLVDFPSGFAQKEAHRIALLSSPP